MQGAMEKETKQLQSIKDILDEYLGKLVKINDWMKFIQVITGKYFHLPQRNQQIEQYYNTLREASQFYITQFLGTTIQSIENLAEETISDKTQVGVLGNSKLHKKVLEKAKEIRKDILKNEREIIERLEKADKHICSGLITLDTFIGMLNYQ